jgi:vitamin B12 transporter
MEIPTERVVGSMTIIGRQEIERRQWRTLGDALQNVPGLHVVQAGGPGKQTSVFTRGTESNHTLVLLDGIEISDPSSPSNAFDYSYLSTDNVERIEILRGPQSTLYGSDAIGGVIKIVTRKGTDETRTSSRAAQQGGPRLSGWAERGSFNTTQARGSLHGVRGPADYSLSFSDLHTRGTTSISEDLGGHERDGYDNRTVSGRLGLEPTDWFELDVVGRFIDDDNELDSEVDDPDRNGSARRLFLGIDGRLKLLDGAWHQRFGVGYTDHDRESQDDPDPESPISARASKDGTRMKYEWQNDFFLRPEHVVTLGLETERETTNIGATTGAFASRSHASARTQAVFLQEQFHFGDQLFGATGLRLDHHEDFGSQLTYRFASAYVSPSLRTRIHGSIATGFKAPSLDELYGESSFFGSLSFRGNPNLDPEKSRGWEVGVEQPLFDERVRLGVTYYQQHIRDLIELVFGSPSTVRNVSEARIDGFESFVWLRVAQRLSVRIDHTYTSAENHDTGEDLLRRPSHKLNVNAEARPIDPLTLSLGIVYIGSRKDVDAVTYGRRSSGGYVITNVAATVRVTPRLRLFGRIDNLFDREYDDPDGFESPGFAGYIGLTAEY